MAENHLVSEHTWSEIADLLQTEHVTLVKPDVAIVDSLTVVTARSTRPGGVQFIDRALHSRLQEV